MDLTEAFSEHGPLAQALPGFRARQGQQLMAEAVEQALKSRTVLIAEAGTGTGKTFAYLVPVLLAGGRTLLSTGTKTLQEQVFFRDLPMLLEALGLPVKTSLLKGRNNYICHFHMERAESEGSFNSRETLSHFNQLKRDFARLKRGDRVELSKIPETSRLWPLVTSTRENCLGNSCPFVRDCFVLKARREAMEADLVVVNHHLFFADVVMREQGLSEFLPEVDHVILDEAHQLPDVASVFFGQRLSSTSVMDLIRDIRAEVLLNASEVKGFTQLLDQLESSARSFAASLSGNKSARSLERSQLMVVEGFEASVMGLQHMLKQLALSLEPLRPRSSVLDLGFTRAQEFVSLLTEWLGAQSEHKVVWAQGHLRSSELLITPLSVAENFREMVKGSNKAWILSSATLSVRGQFEHFSRQLGLEDSSQHSWGSPFDYPNQAVLYVPPQSMPEPSDEAYLISLLEDVLPLIKASQGGAFLLFTSFKNLELARAYLSTRLEALGPLLVQGDQTKQALLDSFRAHPHAVLLGSQSFWEGVDVQGWGLRLVVIDRLPFKMPDDPVTKARLKMLERLGRNAFLEHQVPEAVISLRQASGRLIRGEQDFGVLVVGDRRIADRYYGKLFFTSLPPMKRTRLRQEAEQFLISKMAALAASQ